MVTIAITTIQEQWLLYIVIELQVQIEDCSTPPYVANSITFGQN